MSTDLHTKPQEISASEFGERLAADPNVRVIDVRTPVEFQEVHLQAARNIPLDRIDSSVTESLKEADGTTYVVCQSGKRGEQACRKLDAEGVRNVVNVAGGTRACVEAGLPVGRGRAVMSLERQVRIAAGLLVLIGAVLAMTVHVAFAGLSAFVGAGLVFAGLTDTCGMGMLLARMPWNQTCNDSQADPTRS